MATWGALLALVILLGGCGEADRGAQSTLQGGGVDATPALMVPLPSSPTSAPLRSRDATVGEVRFLNAAFGWAPVSQPCGDDTCVVVYVSDDGGATWIPRTDPPLALGDGTQVRIAPAPAVRLATKDLGWLIDVEGKLYSTTDGAKTWSREATESSIVGLEAFEESIWRLERSCPTSRARCRYTLATSNDYGRHWAPLEQQPPMGPSGSSSLRPEFARPSAKVAYILSDSGDYPAAAHSGDPPPSEWKPDPVFAHTEDGGRTWITTPPPCPATGNGGSWGLDLATSIPGDLWLVCQDEPGSGAMQPKHLYRSSDNGENWSEDLGTPNAGAGGRTAAASPARACRGGSRTSISCTRDGGRTWFWPIPNSEDNPRDGGIEVYQFADDRHGWAVGQDKQTGNFNLVWRTADGGESWSSVKVG